MRRLIRVVWGGLAGLGGLLVLYLAILGIQVLLGVEPAYFAPSALGIRREYDMPLSDEVALHIDREFVPGVIPIIWRGQPFVMIFLKKGKPDRVALFDVGKERPIHISDVDYDTEAKRFHKITYWPYSKDGSPNQGDFFSDLNLDATIDIKAVADQTGERRVVIHLNGDWVPALREKGGTWIADLPAGRTPVEFVEDAWQIARPAEQQQK